MYKIIMTILIASTISGCVTANTLNLNLKEENTLAVMPLIDARESGNTVPNGKFINYAVMRHFLTHGYDVDMVKEYKTGFDTKQVLNMDASQLVKLGPDSSKYHLYVVLNNIETTFAGLYSTANVTATAILVQNKPAKVILFKKSVTDSSTVTVLSTGPIAQYVFLDQLYESALSDAVFKLLDEIQTLKI